MVVNDLRDGGPTESELDKAKQRHGWQLEQILDDPEEVASHFALTELTGTEKDPEARREQILSVTRDQVIRAASEVFSPERLNVVAVGSQPRRGRDKLRKLVRDYQ